MKWSVGLQVVGWEFTSHWRPPEQRVLPTPRLPALPAGHTAWVGCRREVIHVTLLHFSSQEV